MLNVEWTQHPVGHGGFHTGHAKTGGSGSLTWAYDCGSRATARFDDYLENWSNAEARALDWLFISHFDTDHVSGLDTLMARNVVTDVMLPFVNDNELAFSLLHEIRRGNLSRSFFELVADPAEYFIGRGAARVTYVGSGPGGDDSIFGPEPERPSKEGGWTVKMNPPPMQFPRTPQSTAQTGDVRVIRSGCDITVTRGNCGVRFRPYRNRISHPAHSDLVADLRALVGPTRRRNQRPGLGALAIEIAHFARTASGRADLNALFANYSGSPNRGSLSLLSTPIVANPLHSVWFVRHSMGWRSGLGKEVGWLNTGDAELLRQTDLRDWVRTYGKDLENVRVLALPHHGSDANSDAALQHLCPEALLTVQVKAGAKKHPGPKIWRSGLGRLAKVTAEAGAEVAMLFQNV